MSIESIEDWNGMRHVGRLVRLTLDTLEQHVEAGVTTGDLDTIAAGVLAEHGARSAPALFYGFPRSVLISVNSEVVHGIPGRRRLKRGDLVKLDVTVEKDGYIADAARTVVVGRGNATARRLASCARAAFEAATKVAQAGTRVNQISKAVHEEVRRHGFYVVPGLEGHGVGRSIHEEPRVPNLYDPRQRDLLTEGLVLTIEPLISERSTQPILDRDGWTVRTRDGSLAAHHEHTLVITAREPIVLTA